MSRTGNGLIGLLVAVLTLGTVPTNAAPAVSPRAAAANPSLPADVVNAHLEDEWDLLCHPNADVEASWLVLHGILQNGEAEDFMGGSAREFENMRDDNWVMFAAQVRIVNDFFMEYDHEHEELLAANDLGFPLAVAVVQGGITPDGLAPVGQAWIEQTFAAVLEHLGVSADQAFSNVDPILEQAE